jgi:hypothetical protein
VSGDQPDRPVLRVVGGGEPTPEELAAVVVALAMRATAPADVAPPPSAWADRRAMQRRPLHPGPDAWRRSLRRV